FPNYESLLLKCIYSPLQEISIAVDVVVGAARRQQHISVAINDHVQRLGDAVERSSLKVAVFLADGVDLLSRVGRDVLLLRLECGAVVDKQLDHDKLILQQGGNQIGRA